MATDIEIQNKPRKGLYQIQGEFASLQDKFDEIAELLAYEELTPELEKRLAELEQGLSISKAEGTDKVIAMYYVHKNLEVEKQTIAARARIIADEAKRLTALAKAVERNQESIERRVDDYFELIEQDKSKDGINKDGVKINWRKGEDWEPVEKPAKIPKDFLEPQPDKLLFSEFKAHLKANPKLIDKYYKVTETRTIKFK